MSIVYNLDVRCHEMLKYLLYQDGYTSITQLAEEMNISKRSVYYDIRKINEWMEAQHLSELVVERKKGIRIDDEQKAMIRAGLKMIPSELAYVFTPTERVKIIICSILQRNRNLFLDDFMDFCQVSRNTTISDVKEAGRIISEYQLQLIYENGKGYHIKGDLVRKRSIYFSYFSSIADFYKKGILPLDAPEKVQEFLDRLKDIENALDVQYVQGTLYTIAVFFSTIDNRTDVVEFSKKEKMEIMDTKEYEMVSRRFSDLKESEQLYLTLHLLGSRMQSIPVDFMEEESGQESQWLSRILVKAFSRIAGVGFSKERELTEFQEAKTIFCYASMKNEVDTWQLIGLALKQGKNVGVPLCIGKGIMEVRQIHALDDFEEGAYGIMEPSRRCPILSKEKIDMAVIPCVSADREGRRLGHGAGFYDRFLDGVTFPKILVCYKELMMNQVPTEEHDILMDQVICDE